MNLRTLVLLALVVACGPDDDDTSTGDSSGGESSGGESSDGGEACVCDAFGPPGIFEPSVCDDGEECCDYDDDGVADGPPTRLVCFGGDDGE